jgi:hypothetical protein
VGQIPYALPLFPSTYWLPLARTSMLFMSVDIGPESVLLYTAA